ncbi:hypothetical protein ACE1B6_03145 [Aerosakkonemataceae cyanobacterium BLCC-F154]|uniref:Uncharacterized protein n=1 Tax=Floridaenema fluviatile BLCC-F154 TaxID=3153640 RepID=A0ABV4Y616_9CYAN
MLKLSDYPVAIARTAQAIAELDYELSALRQVISAFECKADLIVGNDANLKNDTQRKARRFALLQVNQEYQKAQELSAKLATEKTNAVAHLEYLRNQFSVAKLEARLMIAQQLSGLEVREFAGF